MEYFGPANKYKHHAIITNNIYECPRIFSRVPMYLQLSLYTDILKINIILNNCHSRQSYIYKKIN